MRRWVGVWRLVRTLAHLAHGMAVMRLHFPSLDAAGRHARIQWWSATVLERLGIALTVHGTPRVSATLLAANHVSWLDIAAIHAVVPRARFVSKADIKAWPLVGWLVAGAGTLFIERESKRDALRVVHQMADALRAGDMVAVFPEGTTGRGRELLPFHANLLQAAIATRTAVQPVALRYADRQHAISPSALWLGDTTLPQTLWLLATADQLVVHLRVLAPRATVHADRRALAETLRIDISSAL
ncbi:MAG: lysophospholipid acyltransferase family protein, partial [Burkholderiaceae bacterium]